MCKTIKQKLKFRLSPDTVYQLLVDSKKLSNLTGQKASISQKVGGEFSAQSGRVSGINVDLVPGKRLVQAWRSNEFPEGAFSMATFLLKKSKDGGTDLTLIHRGVPKELIPGVEHDWRTIYWENLRTLQKDAK
jgi:activator of HSP90 ATPase